MKRIATKFVVAQLAFQCSALLALGLITFGGTAFAAPNRTGSSGAGLGRAGSGKSGSGSIAGVVKDSAGTPQMGIVIELLRADSTLVSRVFTDERGGYAIASVLPGQYALKAVGESFLPAIKQNLRVRSNTVVNLTLSTLYDLMQWTPERTRPRAQSDDDWAWTLRSASSRPLLRWLEDGSPVLVSDGAAETTDHAQIEIRREAGRGLSSRRDRMSLSAGGGQFGAGESRVSYAMVQDKSARRRLALGGDVSQGSSYGVAGMMDAMLGFRQEMASSGLGSSSMQTLAAVMSDPAAGSGAQRGLEAASVRSWESLQILNNLDAEAGSEQVVARLGDGNGHGTSVMAAMPFASLTMHHGQSALEYRLATARPADDNSGLTDVTPGRWLPVLSERQGDLVMEHGLHQEVGWSTSAGPAEVQLVIYADNIVNPMIEGAGRLSAQENAGGWVLLDEGSGIFRTAGPNFATTGMLASVESRLPGNNRIKLSYASGDALTMRANGAGAQDAAARDVAAILRGAGARRVQMYSLVLSGTAEETGTRWRASYRWQPAATVTEVAPFALDASAPFLNVSVRQPIWTNRQNGAGLEAQVDLRNLLAEGYEPFVTSDGSHLYFAQAERSLRGGVAFTF